MITLVNDVLHGKTIKLANLMALACLLVYSALTCVGQTVGDIYTFAGGTAASTTASLSEPTGVASDQYGNVFIADSGNNVVWEYNHQAATFSVVAGIVGVSGNTNGALGTNKLNNPQAVAVDGGRNLYISDTGNNAVRVVDSSGNMTTLVSSGLDHPAGLVTDNMTSTATYAYLADTNNNKVWKITLSTGTLTLFAGTGSTGCSGDGGAATSACLNAPQDVALDSSGNLYIADTGHHTVREVSSGVIETFAGNGTQGNSGDGGLPTSAEIYALSVTLDGFGSLYIGSDTEVREVAIGTGLISTVAGTGTAGYSGDGGSATSATLGGGARQGLVFDRFGSLYIADEDNNAVRDVYQLSVYEPPCSTSAILASQERFLHLGNATTTNLTGPLTSGGGSADINSEKSGSTRPTITTVQWLGFPVCKSTTALTITVEDAYTAINDPTGQGLASSIISIGAGSTLIAQFLNGDGGTLTGTIPAYTDLSTVIVTGAAMACNQTTCGADTTLGYIHVN